MPEPVSKVLKPQWTMDIKIIDNAIERNGRVYDFSEELENGDGNALPRLETNLRLLYEQLGGNLDSKGNMLLPEARKDLDIYFNGLDEWKSNKQTLECMSKGKIEGQTLIVLRNILRNIRVILNSEVNRLFLNLRESISAKDLAQLQAMGEIYDKSS